MIDTEPGDTEVHEEPVEALEQPEAQQETEPEAAPAESRRWAEHRAQLEAEARIAREEAERYRREADYYRQNAAPQYDPSQDQNLDPEQRIMASVQRAQAEQRNFNVNQAVGFQNQIDKMKFDQVIASNPAWKKYEPDVEREYLAHVQLLMQTGRPDAIQPRTRFLHERIGREMSERAGKAVANAEKQAQQTIKRQQTRPANISSNVSRSSGASETPAEAARRRLRDAFPEAGY